MADLTKHKDKKTVLKLEFGKEIVREYEGEKADIHALFELIDRPPPRKSQVASSRQTSTVDKPVFIPPVNQQPAGRLSVRESSPVAQAKEVPKVAIA